MLGTPGGGWVTITVNGKRLGSASYLDWVPGVVLEPCIRYLEAAERDMKRWGHSPGGYGFNMEFDGESMGKFGIVEIGDGFYTYDCWGEEEPYIRLSEIDLKHFKWNGTKFVRALMVEAAADIERDFEAWVYWDAYEKEDVVINRRDLTALLDKVKEIISE